MSALAEQGRSTQELASRLGLAESVISRHLKQMTQAGLTTTRREGYYVLYSVNHARLSQITNALGALANSPKG
ncbi:ArsR/SmtB family transcription factor [Kribbella sp. CA-294648]|uniref:ArsR/SmtB family transcription factor n=1 Tax=Kribbella sp. CA-294648 TaxID=3239948 RepID=UPI003D8D7397